LNKIIYVGNDKWSRCLTSILDVEQLVVAHVFLPRDASLLIQTCLDNDIGYTITSNINDNRKDISLLEFDFFVVMGHPFLLKRDLLELRPGIGFHPSMLPQRRGRAPINWAIIDGLTEIGVSLFHLDHGVDSGNIIFQQTIPVEKNDTAANLVTKISEVLVANLGEILVAWPNLPSIEQDENNASYTEKREPKDGEITKDMTAGEAARLVRALNGPYPSAFIVMENGEKLYINEASENEFKL
tara:strand:- start:1021 stop:1746 length:726 start_codon:yes stop_codon:yes gene_type:complete